MKQWSRLAADILAFVMIWSLCSISALAADTPRTEKATRANELLAACLKEHPEYVSAICFDLDGNGVNEIVEGWMLCLVHDWVPFAALFPGAN